MFDLDYFREMVLFFFICSQESSVCDNSSQYFVFALLNLIWKEYYNCLCFVHWRYVLSIINVFAVQSPLWRYVLKYVYAPIVTLWKWLVQGYFIFKTIALYAEFTTIWKHCGLHIVWFNPLLLMLRLRFLIPLWNLFMATARSHSFWVKLVCSKF